MSDFERRFSAQLIVAQIRRVDQAVTALCQLFAELLHAMFDIADTRAASGSTFARKSASRAHIG
ncbi:hypothetical protein [Sinorhizobium sp. NFACC03]|uniref:hypothetical protein n=1 Tax=Sinorhizobium sp. NFACC03 TaxID=1566295 RepID=UPI00115FA0B1|nr:hypothetical protein [Sinorhizobium sp. NFACC03]